MFTPNANASGKELGESVIFQPVLRAYPTCHSWIIMADVSLGHLEVIGKLLIDNLPEHYNYYIS